MTAKKLFTVSDSAGTVHLFALAIPMLIESVMGNLIGFINSAVLSGYSESAVAATGSSGQVINMFSIILTIISTGASVVICNYIGAGDKKAAERTSFTALFVCGGIGALLSAIACCFSEPLMTFMNLKDEVYTQAVVYFRIRTAFFIIPMISGVLSSVLRCYGHARVTVVSCFITITANLFLNILVVKFPQYSPLTGVEGIAAGSVVSQALGALTNALFLRVKHVRLVPPSSLGDAKLYAGRILRIGIPSGLSAGSFSLSQVLTTSFVGIIGMSAVSAQVYYNNVLSYAYLFSMNFGNANSLLVGRLVGAKKLCHAKELNRRLTMITCGVNLCISLTILLLRVPLLSIFTDDAGVISAAVWIFLIDIVAEQARGVSQVHEYALRGVGDMKFMMTVVIISCWTCGVGLSYLLGVRLGLGLIGCWIAMSLDECVRAVASYFRWRRGKWAHAFEER